MNWEEYINRVVKQSVANQMFHDPSDTAASQKKHIIEFGYVPSFNVAREPTKKVQFKAWVTDFQDSYESTWNSDEVYGRMDPIQTFAKTQRSISISWDVVAASTEEAMNNMKSCSELIKMLYPVYDNNSLSAPPLVTLKFLNLAQSSITGKGLVGTLAGFSYTPDFDQGVFDVGVGTIYPKVINAECTFTVLHTHQVGAGINGDSPEWKAFPYGVKGNDSPTLGEDSSKGSGKKEEVGKREEKKHDGVLTAEQEEGWGRSALDIYGRDD